ncbi:DUF3954 domain-containing protein [Bacillus sp. DX4.1]|uniref:DUF3954 domain-containing protein n=1 Tax=Bacillus sp. DX4.1 TaxID=3055867 RepID=UPI0025A1B574|nr:DUF3954 domain-containing protein [Bacillus sp. DX4.1]MDM5189377.1 DUF3954 domain-containing protein [Bacillus sp. DX4.1]
MTKEIFTKTKQLTVEIDVTKNQIYVVKDGRVISIEPPISGYGEQVAVWLNGKVDRVDTKFTEKIK